MARQKNDKPENFKFVAGKGDNQGGKGSVSKTIGPMSATTKLGGSSLARGHVGPKNAPYIDKPR